MILITGVSSEVGQEVARQLLDRGQRIRVVSRNPGNTWPPEVEVISGDLTDVTTMKKALQGVKRIFLIAFPGDEVFPAMAKALSVEQIVFLSSSAVELGAGNPITRMHTRTEELIRQSGISFTFLRPGPFMSNALHWANTIRSERKVQAPYGDAGLVPIDPKDIAAVAVEALVSPGHEDQIYTLTGPELLSPAEQVQIIAEILQQPIDFDNLPEVVAREDMKRFMPEEKVDSVLQIRKMAAVQKAVQNTVKQVTGREAGTFRQFVIDHKETFQ